MIWKKIYQTICHKLKKTFSKSYEIEEVDWDGDTWIEDEVMGFDPDNLTFKSIWKDIDSWVRKKVKKS
ncbi:MAG: hypothetical protein ACON4O_07470 [Lentimonas sp.]